MGCGASRNQVAPCPAPSVATDQPANGGDATHKNRAQARKVGYRRRDNKVAPDLNSDKHNGPSSEESGSAERNGGETQKQSGTQPPEVGIKPTEQPEQGQRVTVQPKTEEVLREESCFTADPLGLQYRTDHELLTTESLGQTPNESHERMPQTDPLRESPTEALLTEPQGKMSLSEPLEQSQKELHLEERPLEHNQMEQQQNSPQIQINLGTCPF